MSKSDFSRNMNEMLHSLRSNKIADRSEAASFFRKILSSAKSPPYADIKGCVKNTHLVQGLVRCLMEWQHSQLQLDATWALTNIVCGDESETHMVVSAGAINTLCTLADQEFNLELRDQAIWALSNIAGDCEDCRQALLKSRFLDVLLKAMEKEISVAEKESDTPGGGDSRIAEAEKQSSPTKEKEGSIDSIKTSVWAVSNMCRGRPKIPFEPMRGFAPLLAYIIKNPHNAKDSEILIDACWTLAYFADGTPFEVSQLVQDNGDLCSSLVSLLYGYDLRLVGGALRALGNIVTGNDTETQVVLDSGILLALLRILRETTMQSLQREAVWTLSNITAGTEHQVQAVLDNEELLAVVIGFLENGDKKTQKEAIWAICNAATGGTVEQTRRLVDLGIFEALCSSWHQIKSDRKAVLTILCGIEACLDRADKPSRRVFCTVLEMFGIRELLDHAASGWHSSGLTERAKQLKDRFFSEPRVAVQSEAENFVEFQFFPRKKE